MTAHKRIGVTNHPLALTATVMLALALLLIVKGDAGAQSSRRQTPPAGVTDSGHSLSFNREVFQYSPDGRRDPFLSLVRSSEIRPTLSDLRLTTIAFDAGGRNSVAVLRDLGTKEQYRVKVGSTLGRMRVVRIDPRVVTFALEEFGYSRQESLAIGDTTIKRTP
ncbi:MAG: pilus assembly protein PilP [Gemmatimonadota bacterium]|nr:pilus assembly protein PilP [Gemmatimonadota bacterium]